MFEPMYNGTLCPRQQNGPKRVKLPDIGYFTKRGKMFETHFSM